MSINRSQPMPPFTPLPVKTIGRGEWIWVDGREASRNVYAFFRRAFSCDRAAALEIAITADSFYWLYIDGRWMGRGPVRSFHGAYAFDTFTVPLAPGPHSIAVLVHHVGEINATMMKGRPALLVAAGLDAGVDLSSNAADWRCRIASAWREDLPCLMSHHGFWEDLDAREIPVGWTEPGFDDSAWAKPVRIGAPGCDPWRQLVPRDMPAMERRRVESTIAGAGRWRTGGTDDIPSKEMAARLRTADERLRGLPLPVAPSADSGVYVTIDCGRTFSGYVVLRFSGARGGESVSVAYDEMLMPCGAIQPERSYQHAADRYRLAAGRFEICTAHPRGFRYVTVDAQSPDGSLVLESVEVIEERYPFTVRATFEAADERLVRWFNKGVRCVEGTTIDTYVDCSTRERVTWLDGILQQGAIAAMAHGDTEMTRRVLYLGAHGQLPDGRINGFVPSERTNCAFPCYSFYWLHTLLDYWLFSGRDDDLRQLWPAAQRVLGFFDGYRDAKGLVGEMKDIAAFFDWAPLAGGDAGSLLLNNAFLAYTWRRMAELMPAELLNRDFAGEARALAAAAHERFWDPERGIYADAADANNARAQRWSQQANAMAVLGGVCPVRERCALLQRITDPARLGPSPVGENAYQDVGPDKSRIVPVGTQWWGWWLVRAFHTAGLDEEALRLMETYWGVYDHLADYPEVLVQHGNTTHCHSWSGGITELLIRSVLGIDPTGPGWSCARFSPHPGSLAWIRATVPTVHGDLSAGWRREGECYHLSLRVPPGIRVAVPACGVDVYADGPCEWHQIVPMDRFFQTENTTSDFLTHLGSFSELRETDLA